MIRRTFRLGIRLGLMAGIAFALFKLVRSRRSASEWGSPSTDWAPAPRPANLPEPPPEPELIQPVILEEVVANRPLERLAPVDEPATPPPGSAARAEEAKAPGAPAAPPEAAVKKATPAKRAATKKAADPAKKKAPATKKAADPAKKAAAEKATKKRQQP
ncbi:MAG: hypothetical protein M3203_00630 [Actinomycetota bacterium]|nr:hypothetical protein [Actinomycetota bacterium]